MRILLTICIVAALLFQPAARAQEEWYSTNMSWLRQTQPIMRFYVDLFEPLERANRAAVMYLSGDLSREGALYELDSARRSTAMISENIEWSIEMLPPAPTGGPPGSRELIGQMRDLSGRLHDLRTSIDQATTLLETFVQDDNYLAYKGGVQQSIAVIDTVSQFIDPYNEITRLGTPAWDTLSQNHLAASKLDDVLSFEMIVLFYSSAILSDGALPDERMQALVVDLEKYSDAIEEMDTALRKGRKELGTDEAGHSGLYESSLDKLTTANEARRKRKSAYHKLLAAFSTAVPSPDLLETAFSELQEAYSMDLPPYKRALRSAQARQDNNAFEEAEPIVSAYDTPL